MPGSGRQKEQTKDKRATKKEQQRTKRAKRAAVKAERRESTETSRKMTLHTKQIAILTL
jgi:hypothetical protein